MIRTLITPPSLQVAVMADHPAIGQEHCRVGPGMERCPMMAAVQAELLSFQNAPEKFQRFINHDPHRFSLPPLDC